MRINFPVLLSEMLRGAGVSLAIFFLTLIIALPLGLLVAAALGFTRWQTFKKIILPQTVKRVVPPYGQRVYDPGKGHLPGPGHRRHRAV